MFCILACHKNVWKLISPFQPAALFISLNVSPLSFALLVLEDLVESDEYFSISIPAFPSMTLHNMLIVHVVTALFVFFVANNKLISDSYIRYDF